MKKRVFHIDEKCFIIYTGKSSADNQSFLRIGNSGFVTKDIQSHIRFIVVPDAKIIDINREKENIKFMEQGKIKYICNKENLDLLFSALSKNSVDTDKLYHQDLSKELENINRVENKKHFFTIFYENKNIKLVVSEEIFFDLFSSLNETSDYEKERERLANFIQVLDKLKRKNKNNVFETQKPVWKPDFDIISSYLFLTQDNVYFPLNTGMFNIKEDGKGFKFCFNSSQRFNIGRKIQLKILENDKTKIEMEGLLYEGEVIESEVLYEYYAIFNEISDDNLSVFYYVYKEIQKKG